MEIVFVLGIVALAIGMAKYFSGRSKSDRSSGGSTSGGGGGGNPDTHEK